MTVIFEIKYVWYGGVMRIRGNSDQVVIFPYYSPQELIRLMFDCQGQHPYGFSFQPQKDDCDAAATLENSLFQLNFEDMSENFHSTV